MTSRWCNAAIVAVALVAMSCAGGDNRPGIQALPSSTAVPSPAGEAPTTVPGPEPSTSTIAPTTTPTAGAESPATTTTAVADTTPPGAVPFVDAPPTTSSPPRARADVGVAYPFVLATSCGITATLFDQREWRNDPPLADPGVRPAGWNPSYEQGTMTLTSNDVAEFTSADGLRTARFVPRPPGSADLPRCF